MARYFFHSEDGRRIPDDEGTELPTLAAARIEAVRVLGDLLKEEPEHVLDTGALRLTVTDEAGLIYFALDLAATDAAAGHSRRSGGLAVRLEPAGGLCEGGAMSEPLPDRLSTNPTSPFYDADVLNRGVGIKFKGEEKTNVDEYCVSEGWIRVTAGVAKDRKGNPLTIKLTGPVEPYWRDEG